MLGSDLQGLFFGFRFRGCEFQSLKSKVLVCRVQPKRCSKRVEYNTLETFQQLPVCITTPNLESPEAATMPRRRHKTST